MSCKGFTTLKYEAMWICKYCSESTIILNIQICPTESKFIKAYIPFLNSIPSPSVNCNPAFCGKSCFFKEHHTLTIIQYFTFLYSFPLIFPKSMDGKSKKMHRWHTNSVWSNTYQQIQTYADIILHTLKERLWSIRLFQNWTVKSNACFMGIQIKNVTC